MRPSGPLILNPRACDRCGDCLAACKPGALKVARTYLKVDLDRCDRCGACARACRTKAIVLADKSARAAGVARARPQKLKTAARAAGPRGGSGDAFRWTVMEAVAMLSVTFAAFTVKELLSFTPFAADLPVSLRITVQVGALAVYYFIQVALLVYLVRRKGGDLLAAVGLRRTGRGWHHGLVSAGLVVAGFAVSRAIVSLYAYVTSAAGLMPSGGTDLQGLFGTSTGGFALAVVMVVLVGPVVEEAVFRAALLEGLLVRFGLWPAILMQAALFAAFHRSLWLLFPTFVLGVVLGWLAHTRGSLWSPIVLHALYNGVTVAAVFLVASGA